MTKPLPKGRFQVRYNSELGHGAIVMSPVSLSTWYVGEQFMGEVSDYQPIPGGEFTFDPDDFESMMCAERDALDFVAERLGTGILPSLLEVDGAADWTSPTLRIGPALSARAVAAAS
ncbi:MAG: hypothetical protein U0136_18155 [Bdellovibrionota bacterium]